MELVLHELSQFMAGDRWLVELLCQAYIPIDETFWAIVSPEDVQLLPRIREMLGEKLVFASSKKRNFVDAEERQRVLQDMEQQVYDSILEYLDRPHFPLKLFKKQYKECRQKVLIQAAMNPAESSLAEE